MISAIAARGTGNLNRKIGHMFAGMRAISRPTMTALIAINNFRGLPDGLDWAGTGKASDNAEDITLAGCSYIVFSRKIFLRKN
jgi:hypothetical protein